MWLIFIVAVIVISFIALVMIWLGSMIIRAIRRADREFDRETEEYKNTKKKENEE